MTGVDLQALTASSIHELKNLLGQLTLSLDEISQADCPGVSEQVEGARFACRRIADRMVAILTLYKLDGDKPAFVMDAHSPSDFLEDLYAEARALAAGRLQVEMDCSVDVSAFWFFDRELVHGALMNAVHNALQHARSRVVLALGMEQGMLCFSVRDDGAGYPPGLLQADLTAPRAASAGTGLGLYFAQAVAKAHENKGRPGRVMLCNTAEGGAQFNLLLP